MANDLRQQRSLSDHRRVLDYVQRTADPVQVYRCGAGAGKSLYELYDKSSDKFKVRGFDVAGDETTKNAIIAGKLVDVGAGTATLDAEITVTAAAFVYVKIQAEDSEGASVWTATLEVGANLPEGGDNEDGNAYLYIPLWYIAWNGTSSRIDWGNVISLREMVIIPAMGN